MSPSPRTPDTEDSPPASPSLSPAPPAGLRSRLFAQMPSSSPSPQDSSPSPHPTPEPDSPPWSTSDPSDLLSSVPDESSAIPSTGSPFTISKTGLRTAVGGVFRSLAGILNVVATSTEERHYGIWAPDAEDVAGVSRPATNLVYRRLPDDAKSGDVIDLFALGIALIGYVGKSLAVRAEVRTARQLQETAGVATAPAGDVYEAEQRRLREQMATP